MDSVKKWPYLCSDVIVCQKHLQMMGCDACQVVYIYDPKLPFELPHLETCPKPVRVAGDAKGITPQLK